MTFVRATRNGATLFTVDFEINVGALSPLKRNLPVLFLHFIPFFLFIERALWTNGYENAVQSELCGIEKISCFKWCYTILLLVFSFGAERARKWQWDWVLQLLTCEANKRKLATIRGNLTQFKFYHLIVIDVLGTGLISLLRPHAVNITASAFANHFLPYFLLAIWTFLSTRDIGMFGRCDLHSVWLGCCECNLHATKKTTKV